MRPIRGDRKARRGGIGKNVPLPEEKGDEELEEASSSGNNSVRCRRP